MIKEARRKLNIVIAVKSFVGALSVATYFSEHEKIAFWMLVCGAALDAVIKYYVGKIQIDKD